LATSGFRGRKSLIVYSEGFIKSPSMPDYEHVIELAQQAHVTVYVIDPRGLAGIDSPNSAGSEYVANATGGRVSTSNDATHLFHEATVESSAYYLIGFQPSPGDPGERKLRIRVRRDGMKVLAPDHYFLGGSATTTASGRRVPHQAAEETLAGRQERESTHATQGQWRRRLGPAPGLPVDTSVFCGSLLT
jgi:hypothetical protein